MKYPMASLLAYASAHMPAIEAATFVVYQPDADHVAVQLTDAIQPTHEIHPYVYGWSLDAANEEL